MNKFCLIALTTSFLFSSAVQAQSVYHAGKMAVGAPVSGSSGATSLYIKGDMRVVGSATISHDGGKTVLTGNFNNVVTTGNVFSKRTGVFEFRGTSTQQVYGKASKATNYIAFPDMVIINNSHSGDNAEVIINPDMGVSMKNITLTKGRLVLDSKVNGNKTDIAHLLVDGTISYKHVTNRAIRNTAGIIQVNLATGNSADEGRLFGFSSPFQTMYADYFFFNFLSVPTQGTFFSGNKDIWNLDPKMKLEAGKGFVVGQGIVPHSNTAYYSSHLQGTYNQAKFADAVAAKESFTFARLFAPQSLMQYMTTQTVFEGEKLNTATVNVPIQEGFNYLGNPFTVPLDLTTYINMNTAAATNGNWGSFAAYEMEPAFYILSPGSKGSYLGDELFSFTASYLVGQKVGSTANSNVLAPMQMFAVKKRTATANTFKLYAGARTHGTVSFLRSDNEGEEAAIDELLIETTDEQTEGFDRLCVVFRQNASLKANDMYDAEKLFNTTGGVNQIYTVSEDNVKLTTNVIPATTTRLPMYFDPSATQQQVTLKADRLNSLQSISDVVLEDKKTGKMTDLKANGSYTFTSSPSDKSDRFVLHFTGNPTGTASVWGDTAPVAWYAGNTVYVNGLQTSEIGQNISLYNMQGQLLHAQKITETNPCKIQKPLSTGVYVVKVEGNPHVIKLMVND